MCDGSMHIMISVATLIHLPTMQVKVGLTFGKANHI